MVTSLESLADQIGISNEVMGVTLSAAGTSMPAYIASRIAAERGFGNQAVANVFGSNTFNIAIGLGLPWAIYIAANGFEPYQDLANEGILESMLILAVTLVMFVVLMVSSGFVLQKWHADMFVLLYVVYILYAILS
jgi:Ca2+/Na+ antiporter